MFAFAQTVGSASDIARNQLVVEPPSGGEPDVGRMLWMLEDGRRRTLETLDGVTDADLDWSPAPGMNSVGALLYHLAAIEADWLYNEALGEQPFPPEIVALFPEDVRDEQGRLVTAQGADLATHLRRLDTVRAHLLAAFREMSPADFNRARAFPIYDVTPEYVLHHLAQHEAEHRGEIGMLRVLAAQRGRSA